MTNESAHVCAERKRLHAEHEAGIWTVVMVGPAAIFVVGRMVRRREE